MKAVKSLFPAICLTIFGTSPIRPAMAADTIQQCIAEVCKDTSLAVSIGVPAFLALEKKEHPGLEDFYRKYQGRLDQIRMAREKQVRESIKILGETQRVTDLIRRMSDQELMSLFVKREPWNLETDHINGEYTVIAKPLTNDPRLGAGATIKQIFPRLQALSPLYAAQLNVDQLNVEPRTALRLMDSQRVDVYAINAVKARITQLPMATRSEYTQKLNQYLSRMESFKNQYGDKIYMALGSLDLELQVKLGRMAFIGTERSSIERLMIDDIVGTVERGKDSIGKIDEIYSPATWEKTCRFAYNRALHYGLTQAEKDRLENQMKPEALRRSQLTLQGLFGSQMTSKIMGYIRTLNIGGPLSMSEYIQYIEMYMEVTLERSSQTDLSLWDRYELVKSLGKGKDGTLEGMCNDAFFAPLRDSVAGNSVILSAYSAKNYAVGLSIFVHEIGHAASMALDLLKRRGVSIAPYEDIRACISENYTLSDRKPIYDQSHFNADKLWTEEDWADAFSGHSLRDLKVNGMCSLVGLNPKFDYSTMASRSEDTHSPIFYRILNIDAHFGNQQPNRCHAPLQNEFQGTTFKDCISPFIRQ